MNSLGLPALVCLVSLGACSSEMSDTQPIAQSSQALTSCPVPWVNPLAWNSDAYDRRAGTVAFDLMRLAALEAQSGGNLLAARSILAPQRYRYLAGTSCYSFGCWGPGIEFDPNDPLYRHVTSAMKATLAFAQQDPNLGTYLANGLWRGYAYTDGQVYPSVFAIPALAQFKLGQTTTVHLADPTSADDSHTVTISGQAWCDTYAITISESVNKTSSFAPLAFNNVSDWRRVPSAFFGRTGGTANGQRIYDAHVPTSPFNGVDGQNPYLLVSINGTPQHWAYESFPATNCFNNPGQTCTSSMEIDPIPYAEPGSYYDTHSNVVGTQSNPFGIVSSLYAVPDHQSQWATRVVNGTQEWGTFSTPVTLFGVTQYKYSKKM